MPTRFPNSREATVLSLLMADEKYGLQIRDEYEAQSGQRFPLGSLYTTLDRMEDKGFIQSRVGESNPNRRGNRRKYYRITASGMSAVAAFEALAAVMKGAMLHG